MAPRKSDGPSNPIRYLLEENRLATFKSWKFKPDEPCSAKNLAAAGFVFIGNKWEPDAVKCFLCDKMLDGWEENDDPWQEHLSHSPKCTFAKLQAPEMSLTINQFFEIKSELERAVLRKRFQEAKLEIVDMYKKVSSRLVV